MSPNKSKEEAFFCKRMTNKIIEGILRHLAYSFALMKDTYIDHL